MYPNACGRSDSDYVRAIARAHLKRSEVDLREHLAKSFGVFHGNGEVHVKVRFSPRVARYVQESKWHDSQKLAPQKDGSLLATFIRSVLNDLRDQGKAECLGKGRWAKWRRIV